MRPDSGSQEPFGSWLDRELLDLALSVNNAALFAYRFADDAVTWVSDGMEALLDLSGAPEGQVRARLGEFVEPLVRAAAQTPLWQDLDLQYPLTAADQQERWIGVRARRVGESGGEGLVGLVTDASAEQQSLTELANRYRLLVELSPQGIAVHQGGVVKYANPAALALLGADSEEAVVGRRLTELVDEDSVAAMWDRLEPLTSTGEVTAAREAYLDRLDGGVVPVEVVSVRTSWQGRPAYQVITRDLTEQYRQIEALRYQASHDELTGLLNRKGINELLAAPRPSGPGREVGLVFCDIDQFKRINDSLGHEAGDEVLSTLAQRLLARLPEHCAAGRLSGDEFVLLCWDLAAVGGLQALMRWVSELLRTTVAVSGQLVHLSASTGAAVLTAAMAGHDLLRYADAAMFRPRPPAAGGRCWPTQMP